MMLQQQHSALLERCTRPQTKLFRPVCTATPAVPPRRRTAAASSLPQPFKASLAHLLPINQRTFNTAEPSREPRKVSTAAAADAAGEPSPAQPEHLFAKKVAGKQHKGSSDCLESAAFKQSSGTALTCVNVHTIPTVPNSQCSINWLCSLCLQHCPSYLWVQPSTTQSCRCDLLQASTRLAGTTWLQLVAVALAALFVACSALTGHTCSRLCFWR